MERCFVKFPAGVTYEEVGPALEIHAERIRPYRSTSQADLLVATLSPEEQEAATSNGAMIYRDFQFTPAVLDFFGFARGTNLWDAQIDGDALMPQPWRSKSLDDVGVLVRAREAWTTTRGAGATIVVVDSGVNGAAPEFAGNARRSDAASIAPSFSDGPWADKLGHGTMVAAIAAGSRETGGRYDGIAPEATLASARTTYAATDLYRIYDQILAAMRDGRLSGPVVINNSYQSSQCAAPAQPRFPPDHPYAEIIRQAVQEGVVMVFAAGNNHGDLLCGNDRAAAGPNTIWTVNSLDEVITVGAVNWDDSNTVGAHANSSRGPGEWAQKFPKPDCVAPSFGEVRWGAEYRAMEWWGTSGSAPVVSGIAALLVAHAHSTGRVLTPAEVGAAIRQSCVRINSPATCVGHGRVDARAALDALGQV